MFKKIIWFLLYQHKSQRWEQFVVIQPSLKSLWKQVDDLWPHDLFGDYIIQEQRTEQTQSVENARVDECDGEYEDLQSDTHEADYENTTGEEHDGQCEDTVSEEQDDDYVNIEGRNSEEQFDDIHSENPTEHRLERDTPGNGTSYHKHCITVEMITYDIQDNVCIIMSKTCRVIITF